MKIVVIQEEIIQTDITPKELTERWKGLEQLPGIDEVVIEVPAHYPNIEQLHTYIGDDGDMFLFIMQWYRLILHISQLFLWLQ